MIIPDKYYQSPEVSNSDLTELAKQFMTNDRVLDLEDAFRFGNLLDALITEPLKVNFYTGQVNDITFSVDEFKKARAMSDVFLKDVLCKQLHSLSVGQQVFKKDVTIQIGSYSFALKMRCKYDLYAPSLGYGGDIKSTACTSQKQFEESVDFLQYDRSRYVYMLLSGAKRDLIIGISKANHKLFKVFIKEGDPVWLAGKEKFEHMAFRWHLIMSDNEPAAI